MQERGAERLGRQWRRRATAADNIAARRRCRKPGLIDRYVYWYRVEPGEGRLPAA
jgi:hypothetical protein